MELPSKLIEAAVDQMSSLPGVGRKTALRLVLNMLGRSEEQVEAFSEAFSSHEEGDSCMHAMSQPNRGGGLFDLFGPCSSRQSSLHCRDIRDLLALEATGQYRGKYHVLGGVISPMDGIGPHDLNIASLMQRLELLNTTPEKDKVEVIFAYPRPWKGRRLLFMCFEISNL